jgi:hypothetical protein
MTSSLASGKLMLYKSCTILIGLILPNKRGVDVVTETKKSSSNHCSLSHLYYKYHISTQPPHLDGKPQSILLHLPSNEKPTKKNIINRKQPRINNPRIYMNKPKVVLRAWKEKASTFSPKNIK